MAPIFASLWRRDNTCNPLMSDAGCGDVVTPSSSAHTPTTSASMIGNFTPGVSSLATADPEDLQIQQSTPSPSSSVVPSARPMETLPIFAIIIIVAAALIFAITLAFIIIKAKKRRNGASARDYLNDYETQKMRDFRMEFNSSAASSHSDDVQPPCAAVTKDSQGRHGLNGPLPPPPPPYEASLARGSSIEHRGAGAHNGANVF